MFYGLENEGIGEMNDIKGKLVGKRTEQKIDLVIKIMKKK